MLLSMTSTPTRPYDDARVQELLSIYDDLPLPAGDAILVLDDVGCIEVTQLAEHWDDVLCRSTASVLQAQARCVVLAIARPGGALLPGDYRIWRDLHEQLRGSAVGLRPLRALPAT